MKQLVLSFSYRPASRFANAFRSADFHRTGLRRNRRGAFDALSSIATLPPSPISRPKATGTRGQFLGRRKGHRKRQANFATPAISAKGGRASGIRSTMNEFIDDILCGAIFLHRGRVGKLQISAINFNLHLFISDRIRERDERLRHRCCRQCVQHILQVAGSQRPVRSQIFARHWAMMSLTISI